ncbi:LamG domain-containing protein [Chloroflexota bacterium]
MDIIKDSGLALYLPLYELEGASFISKDASGHLCTVAGAALKLNGRYFDGIDDFINADSVLNAVCASTAGTIEGWVNTGDITGQQAVVCFGDTDADEYIVFRIRENGKLNAWVKVAGTSQWVVDTDNVVFANDIFYHVALVHNGTEAVMYVNGNKPAQTFSVTTDKSVWLNSLTGIDNVRAGQRVVNGITADFWDGLIGEARVYNRALCPQEIRRNYLATKWRYR